MNPTLSKFILIIFLLLNASLNCTEQEPKIDTEKLNKRLDSCHKLIQARLVHDMVI